MKENGYKRTCTFIAIAVMMNIFLLYAFTIAGDLTVTMFESALRNFSADSGVDYSDLYHAVSQTVSLFAYLAAFMIPAFFFMLANRRNGFEPMRLGVKLNGDTPLVIIAAIGVVLGSAYINSIMVSFIDFGSLMDSEPLNTPVKILMAFISTAIVPAACEEFLYRGCVLSNLLPYGKTTALIGSALLFALMHGNFAQFFYTFMAGIVLGAVYMETGSIWAPTFIHLFNNFYSIIEQIIYERTEAYPKLEIFLIFMQILLPICGLALAGWLIWKRTKNGFDIEARPTKTVKLDSKTLIKGFLNPVMIVHIVLTVGMALMIVMSAMIVTEA